MPGRWPAEQVGDDPTRHTVGPFLRTAYAATVRTVVSAIHVAKGRRLPTRPGTALRIGDVRLEVVRVGDVVEWED